VSREEFKTVFMEILSSNDRGYSTIASEEACDVLNELTATEMKNAGWPAASVRAAGISAEDAYAAGYTEGIKVERVICSWEPVAEDAEPILTVDQAWEMPYFREMLFSSERTYPELKYPYFVPKRAGYYGPAQVWRRDQPEDCVTHEYGCAPVLLSEHLQLIRETNRLRVEGSGVDWRQQARQAPVQEEDLAGIIDVNRPYFAGPTMPEGPVQL